MQASVRLDSGETLDLSLRKVQLGVRKATIVPAVCTYLVSVAARTRPSAAHTRNLFMIGIYKMSSE